jgi:SAM-dependent methyltransferase
MTPFSDYESLRREYATDVQLRIRQEIHERYSVPRVDFPAWVLERVHWRGHETVLDVGAGWGYYEQGVRRFAPGARYIPIDLSAGMLAGRGGTEAAVADAAALPFPDGTFDIVMANHMLYLVRDIPAVIAECKRVLKPDGVLVAATNSAEHMPEFAALFRRAVMLLSPQTSIYTTPPQPEHIHFSLENGTRLLARQFFAVVRHDLPSTLVFKNVEPAMQYLESLRSSREAQLPPDILWDEVMLLMREQMQRVLKHFGELVVNKVSGVLLASDRGDFIRTYVDRRSQRR